MAIWFFIGVDTMAFGGRIAPMSAKTYFEPWRSALTAFNGTERAALFGDGCGRSPPAKSWTTFGGRTDNPMPKAAPMPTSVSWQSRMASPCERPRSRRPGEGHPSQPDPCSDPPGVRASHVASVLAGTVEGQPSGVVAAALEMTPGAVRQAKSRVLRRLREELNQLPDPEGCSLEEVRDS